MFNSQTPNGLSGYLISGQIMMRHSAQNENVNGSFKWHTETDQSCKHQAVGVERECQEYRSGFVFEFLTGMHSLKAPLKLGY